jgi:hypothetical protein
MGVSIGFQEVCQRWSAAVGRMASPIRAAASCAAFIAVAYVVLNKMALALAFGKAGNADNVATVNTDHHGDGASTAIWHIGRQHTPDSPY